MIKVYASKLVERDIIAFLAEFRARVYLTYPIKGVTRKVRGTKLYKVVNAPI